MACQLSGKAADHGSKDMLGGFAGTVAFLLAGLTRDPTGQRESACGNAGRVPARQGCLVLVLHRRHSLPHRGRETRQISGPGHRVLPHRALSTRTSDRNAARHPSWSLRCKFCDRKAGRRSSAAAAGRVDRA